MSTKTRPSIVPTLVVIGLVIGSGWWLMRGPLQDKMSDAERKVTFGAIWEPFTRRDGVRVVITLGGSAKVDSTEQASPKFWGSYIGVKGDRAEIKLTLKPGFSGQPVPGLLACSIVVDGVEVAAEKNDKTLPNQPLICSTIIA